MLVAPTGWSEDALQYRRHHLARYLIEYRAAEIIWIYPRALAPARLKREPFKVERSGGALVEVGIADYRGTVQNLDFLQAPILGKLQKAFIRGHENYLWYTYPAFSELSRFSWQGVFYDCSDNWSEAGKRGFFKALFFKAIKKRLIERTEKKIVQKVEKVFVTSSFLQEKVAENYGAGSVLIENGVDVNLFQTRINSADRPPWAGFNEKLLGFVGGMKSWKVDFKLLENVARARPKWGIVLIGPFYGEPSRQFSRLVDMENVYWSGLVQPEELPGYLCELDVGILPYQENKYNRAVFPLKLFEYLACGLPVVGCGLPSTLGHVKEGIYWHTASRAELFIQGCEQAIKWIDNKEERLAAAAEADWRKKFDRMLTMARGAENG